MSLKDLNLKCEGYEEPCNQSATKTYVDGDRPIAFCDHHYAMCVADCAADQAVSSQTCSTPGCGKPASDYASHPDNPAIRLPICRECASVFCVIEKLYDLWTRLCPACAPNLKDATMRFDPRRPEITFRACEVCKPIIAAAFQKEPIN